MRLFSGVIAFATILVGATACAAEPPGVVAQGSPDVRTQGLPAARMSDPTTNDGSRITTGSPDVLINGKPAARVGDTTTCGVIVRGDSTVLINGRPMARTGDATSGC